MPSICGWTTPPLSCPEQVSPGVVLDYNESNEVVGVEILYLSKRSSNLNLSAVGVRNPLSVAGNTRRKR